MTMAIAASDQSSITYPTNDSDTNELLYCDDNKAESLDDIDDFVSSSR